MDSPLDLVRTVYNCEAQGAYTFWLPPSTLLLIIPRIQLTELHMIVKTTGLLHISWLTTHQPTIEF